MGELVVVAGGGGSISGHDSPGTESSFSYFWALVFPALTLTARPLLVYGLARGAESVSVRSISGSHSLFAPRDLPVSRRCASGRPEWFH